MGQVGPPADDQRAGPQPKEKCGHNERDGQRGTAPDMGKPFHPNDFIAETCCSGAKEEERNNSSTARHGGRAGRLGFQGRPALSKAAIANSRLCLSLNANRGHPSNMPLESMIRLAISAAPVSANAFAASGAPSWHPSVTSTRRRKCIIRPSLHAVTSTGPRRRLFASHAH